MHLTRRRARLLAAAVFGEAVALGGETLLLAQWSAVSLRFDSGDPTAPSGVPMWWLLWRGGAVAAFAIGALAFWLLPSRRSRPRLAACRLAVALNIVFFLLVVGSALLGTLGFFGQLPLLVALGLITTFGVRVIRAR